MAIPKKKSGTKKTVKRKAIVPQPPAPDVPQPPIITDNPTEPSFLSRAWLYIKTHLLLIGLVMLAVIVIILLLRPHKKTDTSRYDELNKAYNEQLRLRSVERERDSLTADYYKHRADSFQHVSNHYKQLLHTPKYYNDNFNKVRNIPHAIPVITNDSGLRSAAKIVK